MMYHLFVFSDVTHNEILCMPTEKLVPLIFSAYGIRLASIYALKGLENIQYAFSDQLNMVVLT